MVCSENINKSVGHTGGGGCECELAAVGGPLRVQIQSLLAWQHRYLTTGDIHHRNAPLRKLEDVEIALRTLIRCESDLCSIRGPRRLQVSVLVVRHLTKVRSICIDDVEIGDTAMRAAESDLLVVRRKDRTPDSVDRQIDSLLHVGTRDVQQIQHVLTLTLTCEGKRAPIVGKRALRVEQAQLFEIRVGGAVDEALDALSRAGVSEPEIDEDFAALHAAVRQEGDEVAVAGKCRRQEDLTTALLFGEKRLRERPWPIKLGSLRQVLGVHRLAPVVTQLV